MRKRGVVDAANAVQVERLRLGTGRRRSLECWFGDGNLNVQINACDIGNALAFNFAVYAASNVTYDDSGSSAV